MNFRRVGFVLVASLCAGAWLSMAEEQAAVEASDGPLSIGQILMTWTGGYSTLTAPLEEEDLSEQSDPVLRQWVKEGFRLLSAKDHIGAIATFQSALDRAPGHARALFGMGTTFIEQGKYEEAEKIFDQLLKENPGDYRQLNNLAWMYATAEETSFRNGPKSLELAQQALLIAPGDFHVWSTLAEAHFVCGNYEKAERAAESALRMAGERIRSKSGVAVYVEQLNKCRNAARALSIVE